MDSLLYSALTALLLEGLAAEITAQAFSLRR
jgi:hypothetical protein